MFLGVTLEVLSFFLPNKQDYLAGELNGRTDNITAKTRDCGRISNKIITFTSSAEVSVNAEEEKIAGADFREL